MGDLNPDYLVPGTRVGAYVVRTMLGQGGTASVYEVESASGHRFALKMCRHQPGAYGTDDWRADQRYTRSILCLQQLKGVRSVVELYGHDRYPDPLHGYQYLIQELVPGSLTIMDWVRRESPPLKKLVNAFLELAELFDRLADADICHRDVKPDNILVAPGGTPKLTGFESATCYYRGGRLTRLAASGLPGTPGYLCPELCLALLREKRTGDEEPFEYHPWSDLYGLGVVFYECLVGEHPFDLNLPTDKLLQEIAYEDPLQPIQLNSAVPFALNKVVMKLLSKNPLHRYPYGEALAKDLRALQEKVADESWDLPFHLPATEDGLVPVLPQSTVLGARTPEETLTPTDAPERTPEVVPEPVTPVHAAPVERVVSGERRSRSWPVVIALVAVAVVAFAAGIAVTLRWLLPREPEVGPVPAGTLALAPAAVSCVAPPGTPPPSQPAFQPAPAKKNPPRVRKPAFTFTAIAGVDRAPWQEPVKGTPEDELEWLARCSVEGRQTVRTLDVNAGEVGEEGPSEAVLVAGPNAIPHEIGYEVRPGPILASARLAPGDVSGRLIGTVTDGTDRVFFRFHEFKLVDGRTFPICAIGSSSFLNRGPGVGKLTDTGTPVSGAGRGFVYITTGELRIRLAPYIPRQ